MKTLTINQKAAEIYNKLDSNKKAVIAFGMTPIEAAKELESYLKDNGILYQGKDLALSFMAIAKQPGNTGMRA